MDMESIPQANANLATNRTRTVLIVLLTRFALDAKMDTSPLSQAQASAFFAARAALRVMRVMVVRNN